MCPGHAGVRPEHSAGMTMDIIASGINGPDESNSALLVWHNATESVATGVPFWALFLAWLTLAIVVRRMGMMIICAIVAAPGLMMVFSGWVSTTSDMMTSADPDSWKHTNGGGKIWLMVVLAVMLFRTYLLIREAYRPHNSGQSGKRTTSKNAPAHYSVLAYEPTRDDIDSALADDEKRSAEPGSGDTAPSGSVRRDRSKPPPKRT